ncbi:MAG: dephospho-CoA kinase, partial [Desulfovibrio sp.]|nr:dephospho-CoA kinase [Desulfovibrio sp.]
MARADNAEETRRRVVPAEDAGSRLDRFLAGCLQHEGLSREKIKVLIRDGKVRVNEAPVNSPKTALRPGDTVDVSLIPAQTRLQPEQGELRVLYRDAALAVINKPAGLTVHPAPNRPSGTLAHRLLAHFPELAAQEGFRPGIVHRLDKDTSGLMLAALTGQCRLALADMFARHEVFKEYLALVGGVPHWRETIIDAPVGRHARNKTLMAVTPSGKSAKSAARLLYADPEGRFSLVAVRIFSGRTHQARVHMRHLGHPLVGDKAYGWTLPAGQDCKAARNSEKRGQPQAPKRQMLHAWKLAFRHPLPEAVRAQAVAEGASPPAVLHEGCLSFTCPPPPDFAEAARFLSRRTVHVVVTGNPGCGKSTLVKALATEGWPVFDADAVVAGLYAVGGDARRLLLARFGDRFVPDAKSPVDKKALGAAMGLDDALRHEVEALVHPLVWHALQSFRQEQ